MFYVQTVDKQSCVLTLNVALLDITGLTGLSYVNHTRMKSVHLAATTNAYKLSVV